MRSRIPGSFAVTILLSTGCGGATAHVGISCGGMAPDSAELNTYVEITLDQIAAGSAGRITVELTRTTGGTEIEMRVDRRFGWETGTCSGPSREYRVSLTGGRVSNGALRIATPSPARVVVRSDGSVIAERLYDLAAPSPEPLEWPSPK